MATSNVYPGNPSKLNVDDSIGCPICQRVSCTVILWPTKGAVERRRCACGQHLDVIGHHSDTEFMHVIPVYPLTLFVPASS